MTIFEKLISRHGGYSLPYLIYLHDEEKNIEMRFANSRDDLTFEGNVYKAGTFKYISNARKKGFNGGGKLEITVKNNQTINLVEYYDSIFLDVIGAIREGNQIEEMKRYSHHYGKLNGDRKKISFSFNPDERQEMTFPMLIWSGLNNHGNS